MSKIFCSRSADVQELDRLDCDDEMNIADPKKSAASDSKTSKKFPSVIFFGRIPYTPDEIRNLGNSGTLNRPQRVDTRYITEVEAAEYIRSSARQLRKLPIPFIQLNWRKAYDLRDLDAYMQAQKQKTPTDERRRHSGGRPRKKRPAPLPRRQRAGND